jgi:hypothetical protein
MVLKIGPILPRVHPIDGRLVLFTPNDGIFGFSGGRSTTEYEWAKGPEVDPWLHPAKPFARPSSAASCSKPGSESSG